MDQSRILALKKKTEEEPGMFTRASNATDEFLQERVVDPLARAGYPNLGAGLASVPSAIVGLPAAREQANARPDAVMAGEGPGYSGVGRVGKVAQDAMPDSLRAQLQDEMMKQGMPLAQVADKLKRLETGGLWKSVLNPSKSTEATKALDEAKQMKIRALFE